MSAFETKPSRQESASGRVLRRLTGWLKFPAFWLAWWTAAGLLVIFSTWTVVDDEAAITRRTVFMQHRSKEVQTSPFNSIAYLDGHPVLAQRLASPILGLRLGMFLMGVSGLVLVTRLVRRSTITQAFATTTLAACGLWVALNADRLEWAGLEWRVRRAFEDYSGSFTEVGLNDQVFPDQFCDGDSLLGVVEPDGLIVRPLLNHHGLVCHSDVYHSLTMIPNVATFFDGRIERNIELGDGWFLLQVE